MCSPQTVQCFLPSMQERDDGHVVNVASVAGFVGVPRMADYCASKHGSVDFTDSLHSELTTYRRPGVHATCVCHWSKNNWIADTASPNDATGCRSVAIEPLPKQRHMWSTLSVSLCCGRPSSACVFCFVFENRQIIRIIMPSCTAYKCTNRQSADSHFS